VTFSRIAMIFRMPVGVFAEALRWPDW